MKTEIKGEIYLNNKHKLAGLTKIADQFVPHIRTAEEEAQHIYHLQANVLVPNSMVDAVLEELNNHPGFYDIGDSRDGFTLIGPVK